MVDIIVYFDITHVLGVCPEVDARLFEILINFFQNGRLYGDFEILIFIHFITVYD